MEYKHLTKGSPFPPFVKGKVRFYQTAYCPFAHRCRLALVAKNIDFDAVDIHWDNQPEWFVAPMTSIPCLYYDNEKCFVGAQIIADFLDKEYPKKNLQSSQHKDLIDEFSKVTSNFYKIIKESNPENEVNMLKALDYFESKLNDVYFGGKQPLWIDYALWPWFERLDALIEGRNLKKLDKNRFPKLIKYKSTMEQLPEVKATSMPNKAYVRYIEKLAVGPAPYDGISLD